MSRYLGVIPAAGTGSRMGGTLPKQYLALGDRPLLYYAIARLCTHPAIDRVCVILAPEDPRFETFDWKPFAAKLEPLYVGGDSRAATVLNALERISSHANVDDWILVHDAARPCLSAQLLDRLIDEVGDDRSGGLLAVPVADTLKRAGDDGRSMRTEPRAGLWQAQTPQMFRYDVLRRGLEARPDATDEAHAVEAVGYSAPRLVQGENSNLKVTFAEDLLLAEMILKRQGRVPL